MIPVTYDLSLREKLAQKLILDVRFFCEQETDQEECRKPVAQLPPQLSQLISKNGIGGVIMFYENFQSIEQSVDLIADLQEAAYRHRNAIPLFVSIDHEGGAVTRLSERWSTTFPGNMAVAATPAPDQNRYAFEVGRALAAEVKVLGINVIHGPVADVNLNPANPVINVRAFSDESDVVARLSRAMADGMLQEGVIPSAKHFPGHGNTDLDSHYALPLVSHDAKTAEEVDLRPFRELVEANLSPMIMTAHIQYPALDSAEISTSRGGDVLTPASLSSQILKRKLREEFGFDGVIISDALDMQAITNLMDEGEAVAAAFNAGVDIALMPIAIRSPEDLNELDHLLDHLTVAAESGQLRIEDIDVSVQRILALKAQFAIQESVPIDRADRVSLAEEIIYNPRHRVLEEQLASASVTEVKGMPQGARLIDETTKSLHFIAPTVDLASAVSGALRREVNASGLDVSVSATTFSQLDNGDLERIIAHNDLVISGLITPADSPVNFGGMDDAEILSANNSAEGVSDKLTGLFQQSNAAGKRTAFISFRFPSDIEPQLEYVDAAYAIYDYLTVYDEQSDEWFSPSVDALAAVLVGRKAAIGALPVSISFNQN
jgi:beta-N-acetylhexosaminidase